MNVTLQWELPTTRTSNRPLAPSDLLHVAVDVSADGGDTWVVIGQFPPEVLTAQVTDLDFGTWLFRGVVVPKKGLPSLPLTATFVNDDTTPPNPLVTLTVVPS
jgi:hypothetical protein